MKPHIFIILFFALLFKVDAACANTLNEVVKEARKQGQVLSAKTRQGVHEVRVVTPQGSVKTIRKPASNNLQVEPNNQLNYYQRPDSSGNQNQSPDNRHDFQRSRKPEFTRFQRPARSTAPPRNQRPAQRPAQRPVQRPTPQPRRQTPPRSADHDPD